MRLRKLLTVVCFALLSCKPGGGSIGPGEKAPDFTLATLSGEERSLSSFQGKVVVLNFWASWCQPCLKELPALQRLYTQVKHKGIEIVAVGTDDDRDSLKQVAEQYGVTFPVLVDQKGEIKAKYKVAGIPETYILKADGRFGFFIDPAAGPTIKIIGPREWDSPLIIQRLLELKAP